MSLLVAYVNLQLGPPGVPALRFILAWDLREHLPRPYLVDSFTVRSSTSRRG